jgi:hypothetical protein
MGDPEADLDLNRLRPRKEGQSRQERHQLGEQVEHPCHPRHQEPSQAP